MIRSQITLKQLEAFVLVVDTGAFRKAGAVLGTTQPNISARVSALESTLGVMLLYRNTGAIQLTEKGSRLYDAARKILWSAEEFLEAAARQDLIKDRLRLGVTELVACSWLHSFLRTLKDAYPSVNVELEVNLSREIDRALATHQLDLAIQTAPFASNVKGVLPIGSCAFAWVASPGVVDNVSAPFAMSDLFEHTILTHARHSNASLELTEYAKSHGLPIGQILHSSSLASCVPMVLDGMGIALLPRQILTDSIRAGKLVELDCEWHPKDLEIFARFDTRRVPRFVTHAAELAAEVAKGIPE